MATFFELMTQLAYLKEVNDQLDGLQMLIDRAYGVPEIQNPQFRSQLEVAQLKLYEDRAQAKTATIRIQNMIVSPN